MVEYNVSPREHQLKPRFPVSKSLPWELQLTVCGPFYGETNINLFVACCKYGGRSFTDEAGVIHLPFSSVFGWTVDNAFEKPVISRWFWSLNWVLILESKPSKNYRLEPRKTPIFKVAENNHQLLNIFSDQNLSNSVCNVIPDGFNLKLGQLS